MKVITVLNQKGGAGKTTIAVNMAAYLKIQEKRVLLIDADFTQESAMTWAGLNEGRYFPVVVIKASQIKNYLEMEGGNYDYVIVDCPPRANEDAGKFIAVSDIILIPVQPSPYDVWACRDLIELIQARHEALERELPHAAFVISRATKRSRIVGETADVLSDTGFKVLDAMTTQHDVYKRSAMTGHTIFDAEERKKAAENQIVLITDQVLEIINNE